MDISLRTKSVWVGNGLNHDQTAQVSLLGGDGATVMVPRAFLVASSKFLQNLLLPSCPTCLAGTSMYLPSVQSSTLKLFSQILVKGETVSLSGKVIGTSLDSVKDVIKLLGCDLQLEASVSKRASSIGEVQVSFVRSLLVDLTDSDGIKKEATQEVMVCQVSEERVIVPPTPDKVVRSVTSLETDSCASKNDSVFSVEELEMSDGQLEGVGVKETNNVDEIEAVNKVEEILSTKADKLVFQSTNQLSYEDVETLKTCKNKTAYVRLENLINKSKAIESSPIKNNRRKNRKGVPPLGEAEAELSSPTKSEPVTKPKQTKALVAQGNVGKEAGETPQAKAGNKLVQKKRKANKMKYHGNPGSDGKITGLERKLQARLNEATDLNGNTVYKFVTNPPPIKDVIKQTTDKQTGDAKIPGAKSNESEKVESVENTESGEGENGDDSEDVIMTEIG